MTNTAKNHSLVSGIVSDGLVRAQNLELSIAGLGELLREKLKPRKERCTPPEEGEDDEEGEAKQARINDELCVEC